MTAVVAASALVDYFLTGGPWRLERDVAREHGADLHVPSLCDLEIVSALSRLIRHGHITPARAGDAVDEYLDLPLTRHSHATHLTRVLELRSNLTAYDASYVALAEALGATLVTADGRLAAGTRAASRIAVLDIRM